MSPCSSFFQCFLEHCSQSNPDCVINYGKVPACYQSFLYPRMVSNPDFLKYLHCWLDKACINRVSTVNQTGLDIRSVSICFILNLMYNTKAYKKHIHLVMAHYMLSEKPSEVFLQHRTKILYFFGRQYNLKQVF